MGGNVFGTTASIKKEDIKPTLKEFLRQFKTIFPKAEPHFSQMKTIGSVGKKDVSGDIDLVLAGSSFDDVDDWGLDREHVLELFQGFKKRARTASDEQLMRRAVVVAVAEVIQNSDTDIVPDIKQAGSGQLFLMVPQFDEAGERNGTSVQVDINIGDVDWLEFSHYSAVYKGNVKGLHRTQLLVSMFSNGGYTFSHANGVKDKETGEVVATTPQQAIEVLNKRYGLSLTKDSVANYFDIMETLKANVSQQDLDRIFDTYLKILDKTRADIPEDLQQYWIDNQEKLGLTGKFLPDDSNLVKYKTV
tara:strand:- start:1297 stop:2208 length:912 start_codon:yes stop_codon:yes gene_type:complete